MKKIWNVLFFAFFISCLFLFKPRQDIVFAAINETQHISLFEKGKDFELCVENDKSFTGTYLISMDTVFLSYRNHIGPSAIILPKKLFINKSTSNIKASDDNLFSAEIYLDLRQKSYNAATNTLRKLKDQQELSFAIEAQK